MRVSEAVATAAPMPAVAAPAALVVTPIVFARWFNDALAFAVECLHFKPDSWQEHVLRLISRAPKQALRIALIACKGPGKSALLAVIVLWFLFTRANAKIICTSITATNLSDGLWSELAKWMEPIRGVFAWTATRIEHRAKGENWYVVARAWAKDADPNAQANALAGKHADHIMFVCDEVSEYPEGVVAAAEGALATGIETILVVAGNCTKTVGSPLYRIATRDAKTWTAEIDGKRVSTIVRVTGDPDDINRSPRVSLTWARQLIELWGRDHFIVRTNVLAEFPLQGSDKLLSEEDVRKAMDRHVREEVYFEAAKVIGIDVARFGDDKTIFFPRQGLVAFRPRVYPYANRSFMAQASVAVEMADSFGADAVFVEVDGLGAGLWDAIAQLDQTGRFIPVNTGSTDGVDKRFHNLRAQMHFAGAEWVKSGGALPDIPDLLGEAVAEGYDISKHTGRLLIQSKDEIKELIGRSPDYWDAFCLTHAAPVVSRRSQHPLYQPDGRTGRHDYNPLTRRAA